MSHVLTIWIFYILTRVHAEWECGLKNAYCHQNNVDYRAIDGSCNNMAYPNWGTKFCIYDRLLPPRYGYNDSFPVSRNGNPLPNPRHISSTVFTEETRPDLEHTVSAIAYGQVVAHDLSQNYLTDYAGSCCTPFFGDLDYEKPGCASIPIPNNDPNYRRVNATCISLLRTQTNHNLQCSTYLPYSTQISGVTAYLDLSFIYGSTNEICQKLRTFKGGKLIVEERNDNEWLPDGGEQRQLFCPLVKDDQRCYLTGDPRVDQNPHLTIFHTIWAREHNRIAKELAIINPHWNDEKLFETARTIAIAEHQHITYYELLPCYGGRTNLFERGILYERDDFVNDYNKSMRPHAFNEFSHGAFRFFHSLTPGCLSLVDNSGCPFRSIVLRDHINRPHLLEKGDNFDSLVRGMSTQASLTADAFTDPEMTDYYFPTYFIVGYDVRAIDIHRSRDHGIASYNEMRYYCGYEKVQYFYQLLDVMDEESVDKLSSLYEHPDDIDLVVGGSLEKAVPGTLAGPTFLCIMYEQFYRTRTADRFFFENVYTGFTLDQLSEIRRSSIARLLCDNGNNIQKMQKHGFLQISGWNPRVSCYEIPGPNLKFWKEPYYDYDYDY